MTGLTAAGFKHDRNPEAMTGLTATGFKHDTRNPEAGGVDPGSWKMAKGR